MFFKDPLGCWGRRDCRGTRAEAGATLSGWSNRMWAGFSGGRETERSKRVQGLPRRQVSWSSPMAGTGRVRTRGGRTDSPVSSLTKWMHGGT